MRLTNRFPAFVAGLAALAFAAPALAQDGGSVTGTFVLKGEAPKLKPKVEKGANVKDGQVCAVEEVPDETLIVDPATKGIKNVFIWVAKVDAKDLPKPKEATVTVDNKNCRFVPHCLIARTGQELVMLNSDAVAHNVHTNPIRGKAINDLVAPNDKEGVKRPLDKPELLPIPVVCDIHPWMKGHMLVLDHPFAALSDDKGTFKIEGLPPGKYDLKVWQEAGGYVIGAKGIQNVEVKAGAPTDLGKVEIDRAKLKL